MSTNELGRSKPMRKLGVAVLAALITLIAGEIGFRVYRWIDGDPYSAARATTRLDEYVDELRGRQFRPAPIEPELNEFSLTLHPYQGFQVLMTTKSSGAALRYFESKEAAADYDIVLIGGSVAARFGNLADTYLTPALKRDPRLAGRNVTIQNVSCPGHKQPQHVMGLQWLLCAGWKPDAVLLIDGYNDIAIASENAAAGVHPGYPYWSEMQMRLGNAGTDPVAFELEARILGARSEAERCNERLRALPLTSSAIAGTWAVRRLGNAVGIVRSRCDELRQHEEDELKKGRSPAVRGPAYDPAPDKVLERSLVVWRESSRSMQAMCRARGIHFLHVLQPAACDVGSKPLTAEELQASGKDTPWGISIAAGYPRLRETGQELQREGVNYLDASLAFVDHKEQIYSDGCHFAEEGSAILAVLIAQKFLETWRE